MPLDDVMNADLQKVFLSDDFAVPCLYTESGVDPVEIRVQFFRENLDKTESTYEHAWCASSDVPNISKDDRFEVEGIIYGLLDFDVDEMGHGVNLFLNEVQV